MSLVQQGSQTPRNKKTKIRRNIAQFTVAPNAIMTWDNDAQVLMSTCPKCGSLVIGFQQPAAMPRAAAGFTICHSSIKPI